VNRIETAALDVMREHALRLSFDDDGNSRSLVLKGANMLPLSVQDELLDAVRVLTKESICRVDIGRVDEPPHPDIIVYIAADGRGNVNDDTMRAMAEFLANNGVNYAGSEEFRTATPNR
jgi:hypothetical protein